MAETEPSLLILIPAHNEEERIGPVLEDFAAYFTRHYTGPFRIRVVLNGCRDDTLGVVQLARRDYPAEIDYLEFKDPIGKGGALIHGFDASPEFDLIGYVDADGATSPAAFHRIVRRYREADCIVGSRWLPDSILHRSQTRIRRIASRVFHLIVTLLFGMGIRDTQCPAKIVCSRAVRAIHDQLLIADLAFDVNLLFSLKRAGFTIKEVATEWTDILGSKVTRSLLRSSLTMFLSIVRLRMIYSPFYAWLAPLRPLETWIYLKLGSPPPHEDRRKISNGE